MRTSRTLMIALMALTLVSSATLAGGRAKETFDKTYPLDAKGVVAVDNVNGDVTVTGWDRLEVHIVAVKECDSSEGLADLKVNVAASSSAVRVETRYPTSHGWFGGGDHCSVEYAVQMPRTGSVDKLELVNGDLKITGLAGGVRGETVNGSANASDVSGDIRLESVNGSIEVACSTLTAPQSINLESVNGTIELRVPANASARVRAETVNGRISNDFGMEVSKHQFVGADLSGSIGNGGSDVKLETVNGAISILKK
jgi:hypothetical protein